MSAHDTPRAFPSAAIDDAFGGMPLLDWYAGQALAGMMADPTINDQGEDWEGFCETVAGECYDIADAMMAERAKRAARCG